MMEEKVLNEYKNNLEKANNELREKTNNQAKLINEISNLEKKLKYFDNIEEPSPNLSERHAKNRKKLR